MSPGKHVKLKRSPNTPPGYGRAVAGRVLNAEWRREGRRVRILGLLRRRDELCRRYVLLMLVALTVAVIVCIWSVS